MSCSGPKLPGVAEIKLNDTEKLPCPEPYRGKNGPLGPAPLQGDRPCAPYARYVDIVLTSMDQNSGNRIVHVRPAGPGYPHSRFKETLYRGLAARISIGHSYAYDTISSLLQN